MRAVFEFDEPACVIVKHANPCGVAVGSDLVAAFADALAGDPVSAYGGILAFNRPIDDALVAAIKRSKVFFEVVAAPGVSETAREKLATRENLRVLELPADFGAGGGREDRLFVAAPDLPCFADARIVAGEQ